MTLLVLIENLSNLDKFVSINIKLQIHWVPAATNSANKVKQTIQIEKSGSYFGCLSEKSIKCEHFRFSKENKSKKATI